MENLLAYFLAFGLYECPLRGVGDFSECLNIKVTVPLAMVYHADAARFASKPVIAGL
jgi:hypothetical protein